MKLILSIPNFKTAGSQYVVRALYRNLLAEGVDVKVLVFDDDGIFPDEIEEHDRLICSWQRSYAISAGRKNIRQLLRIFRKEKPDVYHSWDYRPEPWEAIACRMSGVQYLYTKKNNAWSKRWLLKSILSHHIAYDNPEMKHRFFSKAIFINKISFIPHGVDVTRFRFKGIKKEEKTFAVGCIGVVGTNKNQMVILRALSKLPEKFVAMFYGNEDERYKKELQRYILHNNLTHRVTFHGFVENNLLPEIIHSFDCFVLPSFREAFGVTLLEAMAVGTYCIASHSGGGTAYILENGRLGHLFDPDNPNELADILKLLNKDRQLMKERIVEARKKIEENFTEQREAEKYLACYHKLCSC